MSLSRILPEFGLPQASTSLTITDVTLEEQKLSSFEAGYQAGWDDSASANKDAGHLISADLAQNIGDLSMTYHEAYAALFSDLKPLLIQIMDSVLPMIARETLTQRVVEMIEEELSAASHRSVVISASPEESALLGPVVDELNATLEVTFQQDDTLTSGQVRLSFDSDQEQELDTTALVAGIQSALHGFFEGQSGADTGFDTMKEIA